jgi:ABC-type antimicrobial peptide transport system ATPase subunit
MQLHPVLIGSSEDAYHHGRPINIVPTARRRHLAVFGDLGSGKSALFQNMLAGDIAAGHGVTVVDPHGQLVEEIEASLRRLQFPFSGCEHSSSPRGAFSPRNKTKLKALPERRGYPLKHG